MHNFNQLLPHELAQLPTEADILQYEQRGWYISPYVISDDIIDAAVNGADALYRGERNRDCPEIIGPANDQWSQNKVLLNNEFACLQRSEIWDLVSVPMISAIAATLARTKQIRLFADALMCKYPANNQDNGVFGWHTDKAYWPSCTSNNMLTAWVAMQDTTIDMGPMYVIENSHHWDLDNGLKQFCAHGVKDLSLLEDYLQHSGLTYRSVPITIKKGQMSFHHCNAFHGSAINQSDLRRMSLTIHFQDEKNAYHPVFNESGDRIIIGYDKICREDEHGYPDYHDPNIFPILWNEYE